MKRLFLVVSLLLLLGCNKVEDVAKSESDSLIAVFKIETEGKLLLNLRMIT